jgi:hypothetical protein
MSDIDIKEKFGTGWIGGGSVQRSPGGAIGDLRRRGDEAFLAFGKQLIRFINDSGGVDKLLNVAEKMKLDPQDVAPVVEWLANNYYVRVETEQFGNHTIRSTERAKELLSA